jgi:hypothetical protein
MLLNRRLPEARALLDEAIELGNRDPSIPRVGLAEAMANRGIMLQNEGKRAKAEAMDRTALAIGRREDPKRDVAGAPTSWIGDADRSQGSRGSGGAFAPALRTARQSLWSGSCTHGGFQDSVGPSASRRGATRRGRSAGDGGDGGGAATIFAIVDGPLVRFIILRARPESGEAISGSGRSVPGDAANSGSDHLPDNDMRRAESLFELGRALRGDGNDAAAVEALRKSAAIYDTSPGNAIMARWVRKVLNDVEVKLPGTAGGSSAQRVGKR